MIAYKITCLVTDKCYIGITKHSIEKRFTEHCYLALRNKRGFKLSKAIRKYGKDNFTIECFASSIGDTIYELEKILIVQENSFNWGYNSTPGGEVPPGTVPEIPEQIRKTLTGRKHSPEACAKMSATRTGKPSNKKGKPGKPWTPERYALMTKALKGRIVSAETRAKLSSLALQRAANAG